MTQTTATAGLEKEAFYLVPLKLIDPDPKNPRQIFDPKKLAELAASMKASKAAGGRGVEQPLLLRPAGSRFKIVFGARRSLAARAAELNEVPALIEEMDDEEALRRQMRENGQRDDMHPLEEGDAYKRMQAEFHKGIDAIATEVDKPVGHVRERLKLAELGPKARKLFLDGKFGVTVALYIARIADPDLREQAADEIVKQGDITAQDARDYIQRKFMLRLAQAPFPTDDADLVAAAGSCQKCPYRTGNQRELFADVLSDKHAGGADVCTKPSCWAEKVEAVWTRMTEAAKAKGSQVLSAAETKKVFPDKYSTGPAAGSGYVRKDDTCYERGAGYKKWGQVMGKHAPQPVLARDQAGGIHQLYPVAEAKKAGKESGAFKPEPRSKSASSSPPKKKITPLEKAKQERQALLDEKLPNAITAAIIERAETRRIPDVTVLRFLAKWFLEADYDSYAAERREAETKGGNKEAALKKRIEKMGEPQLIGLLVELAIGDIGFVDRPWGAFADALKLFGVDLKAVKAKTMAEIEAAVPKAPEPAPATKKPTKAKKGGRS